MVVVSPALWCGRLVVFLVSLLWCRHWIWRMISLHMLDAPWLSEVKFDMTKLALTLSMDVVGSLLGIVVPCFESVLLLAFRLGQGALGVLLAAMIGSFVFSHVFGDLCPTPLGNGFCLERCDVRFVMVLRFPLRLL